MRFKVHRRRVPAAAGLAMRTPPPWPDPNPLTTPSMPSPRVPGSNSPLATGSGRAAIAGFIGPIFALSRSLPIGLQWYLFSRLWVRAVLFVEKTVGAALSASAPNRPDASSPQDGPSNGSSRASGSSRFKGGSR